MLEVKFPPPPPLPRESSACPASLPLPHLCRVSERHRPTAVSRNIFSQNSQPRASNRLDVQLSFVLKTPEVVSSPTRGREVALSPCPVPSPGVWHLGQLRCEAIRRSGPSLQGPLGIHVSVSCNFSTVRSVLCNVPISPDSDRACGYPCKGSGGLDEAGPSRVSLLPGFLSLWGCRPSWAWWGAVCRAFMEMTVLERF